MLPSAVPIHVGIVPDGNRRWARRNGVSLLEAYLRGYRNVKMLSKELYNRSVRVVSVYGVSAENCEKRSPEEKKIIEKVAIHALRDLRSDEFVRTRDIAVRVLGWPSRLSEAVATEAEITTRELDRGRGGLFVLLICYSGRAEIEWYSARGMIPPSLLLPPVDLVIRTGGVRRLSGFLPVASDYAELYFSDKLWPDFGLQDIEKALSWFSMQKRNFGR